MQPIGGRTFLSGTNRPIYAAAVIADGASHYYRLDEGVAATLALDQVGTINGTYAGSGITYLQTGATNDTDTAVLFDGVNGWATFPHRWGSGQWSFTMEIWLKRTSLVNIAGRFFANGPDNGNSIVLAVAAAGGAAGNKLMILFGLVAWVDTGYTFPDTNYHHLVLVAQPQATNTVQVFVDGVQVYTGTNLLVGPPADIASIGFEWNTIGGAKNGITPGTFDEAAYYPVVLTPAQIQNHYNIAVAGGPGTNYSTSQVVSQWLGGAQETWRWELLDLTGTELGDVTSYILADPPPVITHDATAAVRRSLTLSARGDWNPNWLQTLLRPRYRLLMPDGNFREWVLGTFTMVLPERQISEARTVLTVKGYDLSQILADSKFPSGFGLAKGTNCVQGIVQIAAQTSASYALKFQIPDGGAVLAQSLAWAAGDSLLTAINQVLEAMTYQPIAADEMGVLRSQPYPNYNNVTPGFTFDATANASLVLTPIRSTIDISQAINACKVIVEDPRGGLGYSQYYENDDPGSPVSVPNWAHVKLLVVKDSKITTVGAAYARAVLEVQRGAWVYAQLPISTPPWPVSQDLDIYGMFYTTTDEGVVEANYLEMGWTHTCKAGVPTTHNWRRLVTA